MSGFHSRWVSATRASSAAPAAARSARSSCSRRWAVESGCFVPVRRRVSWRGLSRKRSRAAAKALASIPSRASYRSAVQTLSQTPSWPAATGARSAGALDPRRACFSSVARTRSMKTASSLTSFDP